MGIVVPILRTVYVALNVYDTFKTLKLPPPSARNGGQPSVRAMSQRKRQMKGCLSVWIIWCCYAAYERTLDGVVGIFIPFYSEIKSLLILFFLLTRARGAEPIYLHVLRPLVKPYAPLLDLVVEVIQQFGDLLLVIFAVPIHIVSSFYHRFIARDSGKSIPSTTEKVAGKAKTASEYGTTRSRRRPLENAQAKAGSAQQIWHPPASVYDDSPPHTANGLPTPPAEEHVPLAKDHDEWRQYEAFPAAYPATPLHTTSTLYSGMPTHLSSLDDISEDPTDGTPRQKQGFHESLLSARESPNPDSDGDLSDYLHDAAGVHTENEYSDEEDYEEEDDFDVTMSTPYPINRIQNISSMNSASDTQSNFSARLSTVDGESPFVTRTNSEASSQQDTDSSAADKRRLLRTPARAPKVSRTVLRPRSPPQDGTRTKSVRPRAATRPTATSRKSVEDPLASDTENKEEVAPKRRVVGATPLKAPARRVPARQSSVGRESVAQPRRPSVSAAPTRGVAARPVTRPARPAPQTRGSSKVVA